MEKTTCPQCNQVEYKTVPAGVSKTTGKPYNAFQVCDACGYKPPRFTPKPNQAIQVEKLRGENIAQAQDRKDEAIRRYNALNAAISLVSHHPLFTSIPDKQLLLNEITFLQKYFYEKNSQPFL